MTSSNYKHTLRIIGTFHSPHHCLCITSLHLRLLHGDNDKSIRDAANLGFIVTTNLMYLGW